MTVAVDVALALLAVGAVLAVVRLVLGPTVADRVVASDVLLTLFALGTLLASARSGSGTYLLVGLVVALLGFVGTASVARFLEATPELDPPSPIDPVDRAAPSAPGEDDR